MDGFATECRNAFDEIGNGIRASGVDIRYEIMDIMALIRFRSRFQIDAYGKMRDERSYRPVEFVARSPLDYGSEYRTERSRDSGQENGIRSRHYREWRNPFHLRGEPDFIPKTRHPIDRMAKRRMTGFSTMPRRVQTRNRRDHRIFFLKVAAIVTEGGRFEIFSLPTGELVVISRLRIADVRRSCVRFAQRVDERSYCRSVEFKMLYEQKEQETVVVRNDAFPPP